MSRILLVFVWVLILTSSALKSQQAMTFSRADTIPVFENNLQLLFPWAGGLNFCQFSEIDLNQDGRLDLFVFDRSGNKIQTYINNGTANQVDYVLAPEFISKFPIMHDWVLLRDYNCDGKMDIFTYSVAGFSIFKNTSTIAAGLQFQFMQYIVNTDRSPNSSHFIGNLFVSQIDLPAIRDVDGDGDLDILTFQNGGNQVEYHKNNSMELFGICDSIRFITSTNCWGEFTENVSNSSISLNQNCPAVPINFSKHNYAERNAMHAGSCLECINIENDGDQDLLIGDLGSTKISLLRNGGTNALALIDWVDNSFPTYDTSLNLDIFPCPFHLDVNNDGIKDLLFSPNAQNTSENFQSCLYYKGTNTNTDVEVTFVQNNFLQENMIDVGEGSNPVFFDYDQDGDEDLFLGNYGYYQPTGPIASKITLFKNVGTALAPSFNLVTRDFANLHVNVPSLIGTAPTFGDLDGDGDKDLLVGDFNGELYYFEKQAGPNDNFVFVQNLYQGIDVGNYATPQLIDVDRDGKIDLLIGSQSGTIAYYHNDGSPNVPAFNLVTNFWGNVNVNQVGYITGYATPCMYDDTGNYVLIVGSERGWVNRYDHIDGNLAGIFTRTDSMYVSTYEGGNVSAAVTDLNSDGTKDMVIGNYSGGLSLWYGDANVAIDENENMENYSFQFYPNPASQNLIIKLNKAVYGKSILFIYDLSGKEISKEEIKTQETNIAVAHLAPGLYLCTLYNQNGYSYNVKLIISR